MGSLSRFFVENGCEGAAEPNPNAGLDTSAIHHLD
jgi:hypothetical protein